MDWRLRLATLFAGLPGTLAIIGISVGSLFGAYKLVEHKGVVKEKVRVEKQGKKTDAQAGTKRAAAERDADRVLERYRRD
jgi:hypothetical protein